jgi:4-phytase/acid phosphatase
MGAYMRQDVANHGLFPATGCTEHTETYLYSDTDERNISSSRATFDSFALGCDPLPIHTVDPTNLDPLFRTSGLSPSLADGTEARRTALLAESPNVFSRESHAQLELLSHILAPDPAHPAEKSIFGPFDQSPVDPADVIAASRPRSIASEIVEDLLLEYVDGKPIGHVGWGRVDEITLRKLIPLRIGAFNVEKRTTPFAKAASSNMLAHILETLDQAESNTATPGALGPPGTRLVYISGHDGDLAGIGGLLGLHWIADGNKDETPPDSQIVFELWRRAGSGRWTIRIRYRAQTLDQLRNASILTTANPPAELLLTPTGCASPTNCSFKVFRKVASRRLDPIYVKAVMMPLQVAP